MNTAAQAAPITLGEFELIQAARRLHVPVPREAILTKLGEVADLVKSTAANTVTFIDPLAPPKIVFLGANGKPLPDDAGAMAFELPQYGRTFLLDVLTVKNADDADRQAKECRALGHSDWFVPKDMELQLLVNRKQVRPATHPELVKYTPFDDYYITSSPYPSDSSYVCMVGFGYGLVYWYYRYSSARLRLCRLSAASQ